MAKFFSGLFNCICRRQINVAKHMITVFERAENIVGKKEMLVILFPSKGIFFLKYCMLKSEDEIVIM